MLELYWICFIFGVGFVLVTVIFGDVLGGFMDGIMDALSMDGVDFLQPMVLVGGITCFGGLGILLTQMTSLGAAQTAILSFCGSIGVSACTYFFYVKPMARAENSTSYQQQDLVGRLGEVSVTIPKKGWGEVILSTGTGRTNEIAASFDEEELGEGTKVVIIEIRDRTLYVSKWEEL
ncbi:protease [Marinicrinis sediminis]|uniref:Protease n=1 Tax=Marinicrinis sediminis TaxID=1652465 RepID=A0ABW5RF46_9BACL